MHVTIDFHFVKKKVIDGSMKMECIPSQEQVTDIFTKILSSHWFVKLRTKLCDLCRPRFLWKNVKIL